MILLIRDSDIEMALEDNGKKKTLSKRNSRIAHCGTSENTVPQES